VDRFLRAEDDRPLEALPSHRSREGAPRSVRTQHLDRVVTLCGAAMLAVFALLVPLSFAIATHSPFDARQPREQEAFARLVEAVPALPDATRDRARAWLAGDNVFDSALARGAVYGSLLAIATATFAILLAQLARDREAIDDALVRRLLRFAWAFGALQLFAYPMFTQDLWRSVAWGRMWADGVNPYFVDIGPEMSVGIPLDAWDGRMTYGPLWTALVGGIESLVPRNPLAEFFAHKLVLLACYGGVLHALLRIHSRGTPALRATAIALFGWMPLSAHTVVGAGHNDITMTFAMVLWLEATAHRRAALAAPMLVVSILFKYVSAPLLAFEVLALREKRGRGVRIAALALSLAAAVVCVAAFSSDGRSIFESTTAMQSWHLFTPADALVSATGFPRVRDLARLALIAAIGIAVLPSLRAVVRSAFASMPAQAGPNEGGAPFEAIAELTLAAMLAAACAVVSHTWPWFLVWPLAAAAVAPRSRLLTAALPLFLVGPFFHLVWASGEDWLSAGDAGVALYGALVLLLYPTRRFLLPALR